MQKVHHDKLTCSLYLRDYSIDNGSMQIEILKRNENLDTMGWIIVEISNTKNRTYFDRFGNREYTFDKDDEDKILDCIKVYFDKLKSDYLQAESFL